MLCYLSPWGLVCCFFSARETADLCPPMRPISAMRAGSTGLRLALASLDVSAFHLYALPLAAATFPPLDEIARCVAGSIAAKPRRDFGLESVTLPPPRLGWRAGRRWRGCRRCLVVSAPAAACRSWQHLDAPVRSCSFDALPQHRPKVIRLVTQRPAAQRV